MQLKLEQPFLIFIDDPVDLQTIGKTAAGICFWRPEACLGQFLLNGTSSDLNLPVMNIEEAALKGAKSLVIGTINFSEKIKQSWVTTCKKALEHGLNIISGMHEKLSEIPELKALAKKQDRNIIELRHPKNFHLHPTGKKRTGKRILTVGTDCSVGKMFTALKLTSEMKIKGFNADFRATGQTGILIAGCGIPFDAIPVDFCTGAIEALTPDNDNNHWDIIEGQGATLHPACSTISALPACGVVSALIYGSQPDYMILCHEATRHYLYLWDNYPIRTLDHYVQAYESIAKLTNPKSKVIGISINTSKLEENQKNSFLKEIEEKYQLPTVDPCLSGTNKIIEAILNHEQA